MAKKFYAVRCGQVPGIYTSWDECRKNVHGFGGAEYKSFSTLSEAESFMAGKTSDVSAASRDGAAVAYVDGSFDINTSRFSYGAVIFVNGTEIEMSCAFSDAELASMRNVAGEIKGAEAVMQYCIDNSIDKLDIYYDYEGIEKWCSGAWRTNKEGTSKYKAYYDAVKSQIDIRFIKVKGHSGDVNNDRADLLAKSALGIGG
ncbi:MAG: ribonuclease H family protein [Clostridiales bacterium]|nr:ribonuclease H family protein [Clostridiales bacterium]